MFTLAQEKHFEFSFSKFIDYATSIHASSNPFSKASNLSEGVIYSYNATDDPHDLTFSTENGSEYGIGGISLIRRKHEVAALMVAGKIADLSKASEDYAAAPINVTIPPNKKGLEPHPSLKREAVALESTNDMWKTLIFTRMNIVNRTFEVRYIDEDIGNGYLVNTDDPIVLEDLNSEMIARTVDSVTQARSLFGLCATAILLPDFFKANQEFIRKKTIQTSLAGELKTPEGKKHLKYLTARERIVSDTILSLPNALELPKAARRLTTPPMNIEVSGYWKPLPPNEKGIGPSRETTLGKTWITTPNRTSAPSDNPTVLVKSHLSINHAASQEDVESPYDDPGPFTIVSREDAYIERKKLTNRVRWRIIQRDNFRCVLCGADSAASNYVRLEVDHIHPVSKGGKTVDENLRTLCNKCNNGKGNLV